MWVGEEKAIMSISKYNKIHLKSISCSTHIFGITEMKLIISLAFQIPKSILKAPFLPFALVQSVFSIHVFLQKVSSLIFLYVYQQKS